MSITIEAIYESGVFKPLTESANLKEGEKVRLTIEPINLLHLQRQNRIELDSDTAREIVDSADFSLLES